MKKPVVALLAVVVVVLLFFVYSSKKPAETPAPETSSAGGTVRIGVVTPDADHGFTSESVAHARDELVKLAGERGFEYKFEVGGEADVQIAAIEAILEWEPDVIVLWPLEGKLLRSTAQKIMDQGVSLIIYDRLIEGFKPTAEIMGDNEEIGRLMGEYLLKYFAADLEAGKNMSYLRFIGDSSTVSIQRSGSMDDVIKASRYADRFKQIRDDYQTDWSNATAQEQMENWLNTASAEEISSLNFIVTHDDEVVDGVVVALQNYYDLNPSASLSLKLITGVSGRRETFATFDKPVIGGLELVTYNFSPSMIREAIRLGAAVAYGEQYDGQDVNGQLFLIDTLEVDKNNVDEFRSSEVFKERYSLSN